MCGFAVPGINALALLVEISTIFLNIRSFIDKEELGNFFS
jgi:hypothetical protein